MSTTPIVCLHCGHENDRGRGRCDSCEHDLGFPNVNVYADPYFTEPLQRRYAALAASLSTDQLPWLERLRETVDTAQGVINLDLNLLRLIVVDKQDYLPYRTAVEKGKRVKASFLNDKDRCTVETSFYGIEGGKLVYAALTLHDEGLQSYGPISLLLKTPKIAERTTVFEANSFTLFKSFQSAGWKAIGPIPTGSSTIWEHRSTLVACKIGTTYCTTHPVPDVAKLLLQPGKARNEDEFVELHIFSKINRFAIQRIILPDTIRSEFDRLQADNIRTEAAKLKIEITES